MRKDLMAAGKLMFVQCTRRNGGFNLGGKLTICLSPSPDCHHDASWFAAFAADVGR